MPKEPLFKVKGKVNFKTELIQNVLYYNDTAYVQVHIWKDQNTIRVFHYKPIL